MRNIIPVLAACVMLAACDEDPGPTVMTITAETGVIAIAANQLSNISIEQAGSERLITFRLNSSAAQAFSKMTAENIGKEVNIAVCDEVVTTPRIMEQISGGSLQISGLSSDEVSAVANKLTGAEPCS